jgi:hypothetical protein
MDKNEKQELLRKLDLRERILKGQLNFYVRYRHLIPEGMKYADERINQCLDELKSIWALKKELGQ